jgi:predicted amidophosphoribosyltransferase
LIASLLELVLPSLCPSCDGARSQGATLLCTTCARGLVPARWLEEVRTAIAFEGTGARLVRRFKFERRRDGLRVLMPLLVERVVRLSFDAVVPVPRHPSRIREQGSDPAFELARRLGRRVGVRVIDSALARSRPTRPQTGLVPEERLRNVLGSFRARPAMLRGRSVLLLDDVATTGATLECAAAELRSRSGAARVLPVALAGTRLYPAPAPLRYNPA